MSLVAWGLVTLVGVFIGYLAGYLRKKGENLATHEDIDKLVEQVRVITTTTKEIEAKISTDVWNRQKRWEMKREVLFLAAKRLAALDDALIDYALALDRIRSLKDVVTAEEPAEECKHWLTAAAAFEQSMLFVFMVCGKETQAAFEEFWRYTNLIAAHLGKGPETYDDWDVKLVEKRDAARADMRKELDIDEPIKPESGGSFGIKDLAQRASE
jgi:hypothetical protein